MDAPFYVAFLSASDLIVFTVTTGSLINTPESHCQLRQTHGDYL